MTATSTFSKVQPRTNGEIGRSVERMLQSTAHKTPNEEALEARLRENLAAIKETGLKKRHSRAFLFAQTCLNYVALAAVLLGFPAGVALLFHRSVFAQLLGAVWLVYVKVLSFLVHHELVHGTVFRRRKTNQVFGRLVDVVNGGQYWTFEELQRQHIEHHADKVDYVSFDAAAFMAWLPAPLEYAIVVGEWCFVPVMAFVTRLRSVSAAFWHPGRRHMRGRTLRVLAFRGGCYAAMAWASPRAMGMYFVSHCAFVNCYRLLDCFSHTFEELPVGAAAPKGLTAAYEQNRTISLMATRSRQSALNMLFLNFGFHGAHHVDPAGPWLGYPSLDEKVFEGCEGRMPRHVSLGDLFGRFVRERVARVYHTGGMGVPLVDKAGNLVVDGLWGVLDPSILMLEVESVEHE